MMMMIVIRIVDAAQLLFDVGESVMERVRLRGQRGRL